MLEVFTISYDDLDTSLIGDTSDIPSASFIGGIGGGASPDNQSTAMPLPSN